MTVMTEIPHDSRTWTLDELDHLPDDGSRYELLDGRLLVSPAPVVRHQVVVGGLHVVLHAACPPGLQVLFAPVDWRPGGPTSLQPDLLVVEKQRPEAKNITGGLLLAVEVLSPSTRRVDLVDKRATYESAGVPSYWVVDVDVPSVVAWELADGRYRLAGETQGNEKLELEQPFPVSLIPELLVRSDRL
jgi:Uma2 family endonuclease